MAHPFREIEPKWQQFWRDHQVFRAFDPDQTDQKPFYVLDMFPYPSGAGLHVGHPEGYTATDILARYKRMQGFNVLHPMGWDAFGLPAEQYAISTGTHPAETTAGNIENFRRQIEMLGLGYDWQREVNTTDPGYYKWTQWIFLQIYNSYYDPIQRRAMPISHLENELFNSNIVVAPDGTLHENPTQEGLEAIAGEVRVERRYEELSLEERREIVDSQRLAYIAEVPVNWCPALGTVLANEEVIDGRSERGGHPVERRPMRQWMLRITAYSDRLLEDLEKLDWPDSLKEMQRNWIGRSEGAVVEFFVQGEDADGMAIEVFTTRPDTVFGATYMVLAPEHPLVDQITTPQQREAVEEYRAAAINRSERERTESRQKTGVFTGAFAINPLTEEQIPIWVADYVVMGYGTGAIMAVPAHDERDFEFAGKYDLPIRRVVRPAEGEWERNEAFTGEGVSIESDFLDGLPTREAIERVTVFMESEGIGRRRVSYKLRDWLFSRQRYWGEPFPILIDEEGNHHAVPEEELPVKLPEVADFRPTGSPEGPLAAAKEWLHVERDGRRYRRETNTMPQWAGSCWYYLRYLDPDNSELFVDPKKERYWMPVDLYVGGVEHAVLHLLYARFWHKVLFDLGHLSSAEPFQRLVNQGMILGETEYHAFRDEAGELVSVAELTDIREEAGDDRPVMVARRRADGARVVGEKVAADAVEKHSAGGGGGGAGGGGGGGSGFVLKDRPEIVVDARAFKMSKSRGNVINPDPVVEEYGADVFRLYEMYMGPLEATKPWNTRDIVGMSRFLNSVWRTFIGDVENGNGVKLSDEEPPEAIERQLHRTIFKVGEDIEGLRFNTAIAELIKLINEVSRLPQVSRRLADAYVRLLAPFAPHIAEEIWHRALGHRQSVALAEWPRCEKQWLHDREIEVPVQVNGKLRGKVKVPADASEDEVLTAAEREVSRHVEGKELRKRLYVPGKMVNLVVG